MKIVFCGSAKLFDKMDEIKEKLVTLKHEVVMPNNLEKKYDYSTMTPDEYRSIKNQMIIEHMKLIKDSDAILVLNERLKDIDGYIGANSFLEMGFALAFGKKIFIMNPVPKQPNEAEMEGLLPIVVNGDLSLIK